MFPDSIIKKVGERPGKTVAVFSGIHGNEKAGFLAMDEILESVQVTAGTVYFVYANPPAIAENKRFINQNLNRLFNRDISGDTYEVARAIELMNILDDCDALLDLHSYNSESGEPFVIAERNADAITTLFEVPLIAEGFGDMGYGTDDYMFRNGKIGICLECGTTNKYHEFVPFAVRSVKQFLHHFGCIDEAVPVSESRLQKRVRAKKILYKQHNAFRFAKNFLDFEELPINEPYIFDGDLQIVGEPNEIIMFPRPDVSVGEEVCIIGELVE